MASASAASVLQRLEQEGDMTGPACLRAMGPRTPSCGDANQREVQWTSRSRNELA